MIFPRFAAFLLALLLAGPLLRAETPEERAKTVRVTINVTDVPPVAVAQFLEAVSNIKIHYAARPSDPLLQNVNFENSTADEALRYLAGLANLELTYQADGAHFDPKK